MVEYPIASDLHAAVLARWRQRVATGGTEIAFVAGPPGAMRSAQLAALAEVLEGYDREATVIVNIPEFEGNRKARVDRWLVVATAVGGVATTSLGYSRSLGLMILAIGISAGLGVSQIARQMEISDADTLGTDKLDSYLNSAEAVRMIVVLDLGITESASLLRLSRLLQSQSPVPLLIIHAIDDDLYVRVESAALFTASDPAAIVRDHMARGAANIFRVPKLTTRDLRRWQPNMGLHLREFLFSLTRDAFGFHAAFTFMREARLIQRDHLGYLELVSNFGSRISSMPALLDLGLRQSVPTHQLSQAYAALQSLSISGRRGFALNLAMCKSTETTMGAVLKRNVSLSSSDAFVDYLDEVLTGDVDDRPLLQDEYLGNSEFEFEPLLWRYQFKREGLAQLYLRTIRQPDLSMAAASLLESLEASSVHPVRAAEQLATLATISGDEARLAKYSALAAPVRAAQHIAVAIPVLRASLGTNWSADEALRNAKVAHKTYSELIGEAPLPNLLLLADLVGELVRDVPGLPARTLAAWSALAGALQRDHGTLAGFPPVVDSIMVLLPMFEQLSKTGQMTVAMAAAEAVKLLTKGGNLDAADEMTRITLSLPLELDNLVNVLPTLVDFMAIPLGNRRLLKFADLTLSVSTGAHGWARSQDELALDLAACDDEVHLRYFQLLSEAETWYSRQPEALVRCHFYLALGIAAARQGKIAVARSCLSEVERSGTAIAATGILVKSKCISLLIDAAVKDGKPGALRVARLLAESHWAAAETATWVPTIPKQYSVSSLASTDELLSALIGRVRDASAGRRGAANTDLSSDPC